jgi:hypothetical protein
MAEALIDFGFTEYGRSTSLPMGIDAGTTAPGPMFPLEGLPTSGGMSTKYIEGRNTELRTNGYITRPYRCLAPPWASLSPTAIEDNLDYQSIVFSRVSNETLQQNALSGGKWMHDSGSVIVSIAALNYYLKTEAGRREFGDETDCVKFKKHWRLLGGCVTNPQEKQEQGRAERVITVATGKRFRCKNIWAMHKGHKMMAGDHLFVVMERYNLDSSLIVEGKAQKLPRWDTQFEAKGSAPSTYWQAVPVIGRWDNLHSTVWSKTQTIEVADGKGGNRVSDCFFEPVCV